MMLHNPKRKTHRAPLIVINVVVIFSQFYIVDCSSLLLPNKNATTTTIAPTTRIIRLRGNDSFSEFNSSLLAGNYREGRRSVASGGLFSIVSFDNVPCSATSGDVGTCYTARECTNLGGTQLGVCAGNFGVCCVVTATCEGNVTTNNTYLVNPSYPGTDAGPKQCCTTVTKLTGATQLYLEMETFSLTPPDANGDCSIDSFTVTVSGSTTTYPILCGDNSGQTEYIFFGSSSSAKICFQLGMGSNADTWKIRLLQLKPTDSCAAPLTAASGCTQYYQDITGTITSFDYTAPSSTALTRAGAGLINNYCCTSIFKLLPGYCNIMLSENDFMISGTAPNSCTTSYLLASGIKFCGDTLDDGAILLNSTSFTFCSGPNNAGNSGYSLTYTQIPCSMG